MKKTWQTLIVFFTCAISFEASADILLVYAGPKVGYSIKGWTFSADDYRSSSGSANKIPPLGGGLSVGGTAGIKLFNFIGAQTSLCWYDLDDPGNITSWTLEVVLGPTIADFLELGALVGVGSQWLNSDANLALKAGALLGLRLHEWFEVGVNADADFWWFEKYAAANITLSAWLRLTI
ncbi:MAG: hypothetical protein GXP49_08365 [Deltaproteobacteria bacterium]|nr:hypothetical protein [Deltaproteobacteria bacterium]